MLDWLKIYARLLTGGLLLLGGLAACYFFLISPAVNRSNALRQEMQELGMRLEEVGERTTVAVGEVLQVSEETRELVGFRGFPGGRHELPPERDQASSAARSLARMGARQGLHVDLLSVPPERIFTDETGAGGSEELQTMVVELHVEGTYLGLGGFLEELDLSPIPNRVLWISAERAGYEGEISAVVSVGIPLFPEGTVPLEETTTVQAEDSAPLLMELASASGTSEGAICAASISSTPSVEHDGSAECLSSWMRWAAATAVAANPLWAVARGETR